MSVIYKSIICGLLLVVAVNFECRAAKGNSGQEVKDALDLADRSVYSDPAKAVFYANNARLKAEQANDSLLVCDALVVMGRSYVNLGAFDMAFEALYGAYDKCPMSDKKMLASINVSIGSLYKSLNDLKKASDFIERANRLYTQLGDLEGMAACYNVQGLVYVSMEANEEAEKCFKQALKLNRELGDQKAIAKNLNNLGLYRGNTSEKIRLINEAIRINKLIGAIWSLAENYNNLGTQYYYAGDYRNALEWLEQALITANKLSAKELICDNYRYQMWVYEAMGNHLKAYENLQKLYELEKDMLSERKIRDIEINVADRRFQRQQTELNLKQKEFQIRTLKQNIILIISVSCLLLLLILYFLVNTRQKKKMQVMETEKRIKAKEKEMIELQLSETEGQRKNMEAELEHNRRELTNFACYVRSKNELLQKIKNMIRDSYKEAKPEVKAQLKTINAFINQYQDKENDLDTLIREIERVNAEFITRLTDLHPDLSKNEKQLASLLRIDLSTKEIALLIGSTPKTVNMARYRLRKRLGLDTDDGLNEYMKKM